GRIATVGDDVNDVTMVRGAGLGAAMPDSAAALAAEADYQITTSLADFIHRLIAGEIG
ncbi:MAG: HAD hydrolase family protein, partial [Phycisphaerae bacterium]|nr:HAD hydrolase family protein [Phycisphaerae bacterium]